VVKLKRPVDLGFVDFRDPEKRKQACVDEVRLNQRLTADVYLGVVSITESGVDGTGEPLEWAVVMRRLPAERMLDRLLQEGTALDDLAERLADRLIPFHQSSSAPSSSRAQSRDLLLRATQLSEGSPDGLPREGRDALRYDRLEGADGRREGIEALHYDRPENECPQDPNTYLTVLTDNLAQVAEVTGDIVGQAQLGFVDRSMRAFLCDQGDLLESRLSDWLREGHGDLRCEHICLEPEAMQIYDCVEFEIAIRCADVASDLAFLLMDLRRLGAEPVAAELLGRYRAAGFDLPQPVVDLYAAHRALVRAKVAALERSGDDADTDRRFGFEAASYLDIATSFACPTPPMLVLVSGLSGSGKSTVAESIGRATNGAVLSSDRVRKELAGLDPSDSAVADWHQGIYTDEWTSRTYDRLLELAKGALERGKTAVVDATFLDNEQRERFVAECGTVGAVRERSVGEAFAAARRFLRVPQDRLFLRQDGRGGLTAFPVMIVWTELDDAIARTRIARRDRERNTASDATFAIRELQIGQLAETPLRIPAGALGVTIDTGADGPASLDPFFVALDEAGLLGSLRHEGAPTHA
jgi:aminoglycoside phosphotransferase family enzyme/predicted kinase